MVTELLSCSLSLSSPQLCGGGESKSTSQLLIKNARVLEIPEVTGTTPLLLVQFHLTASIEEIQEHPKGVVIHKFRFS